MESPLLDIQKSYRRALYVMEDAVSDTLLFSQLQQTNPLLADAAEAIVKQQWEREGSPYRKQYPDRNHFLRIISTDLQLVTFGFADIAQRERYETHVKNTDTDLLPNTTFNDYYFLGLCENGAQIIISPGSSPVTRGSAVAYKALQDADGNALTAADTLPDFTVNSDATVDSQLTIGVPVSLTTNGNNLTTSPLRDIYARYAPNRSFNRITNTIRGITNLLEKTMRAAYTVASGIPLNNTPVFGRQ